MAEDRLPGAPGGHWATPWCRWSSSAARDLYRIVSRGEGDGKPLRMFTDACARATAEEFTVRAERNDVRPRVDADLLARVRVGEQIAVLRWWVEQETPPMAAEDVVRTLLDLALHGRYWASGFDAPA